MCPEWCERWRLVRLRTVGLGQRGLLHLCMVGRRCTFKRSAAGPRLRSPYLHVGWAQSGPGGRPLWSGLHPMWFALPEMRLAR